MIKFGIIVNYNLKISKNEVKKCVAISTGNTYIEAVSGLAEAVASDIVFGRLPYNALSAMTASKSFKVAMLSLTANKVLAETDGSLSWKQIVTMDWRYKNA